MALAASLKPGALSDHHRLIRQFEAVPLMITSMAIPDRTTTETGPVHRLEANDQTRSIELQKNPPQTGPLPLRKNPTFPMTLENHMAVFKTRE